MMVLLASITFYYYATRIADVLRAISDETRDRIGYRAMAIVFHVTLNIDCGGWLHR